MVKKLAILAVLTGLFILYAINPEQFVFAPKCPFYWLTGLQCPACGTQRAIHQLLHLHVKEALGYNLFLLVSMPYLAALAWTEWFDRSGRFTRLKGWCRHPYVTRTYLVLLVVWWVGRNAVRYF
ncbi:MAG: DUF2752 domain-containing protein [Parabacteroides sp.]|nr:DUF2752 domain-containing protein [Parabacteroides sp.]